MEKTYRSKIGIELILILTIVLGFSFYKLLDQPKTSGIITLGALLVFILYIVLSIQYKINDDILTVKAGFLVNTKIDIQKIKKIKKTFNPLSSPAASIDRLEICYNNGDFVLISPKNRDQFIKDLLEINPNIEVKL